MTRTRSLIGALSACLLLAALAARPEVAHRTATVEQANVLSLDRTTMHRADRNFDRFLATSTTTSTTASTTTTVPPTTTTTRPRLSTPTTSYKAQQRPTTGPSHAPSANEALGQQMAAQAGWAGSQWKCLDTLWGERESGWNEHDLNPYSGAYGIPQALPGSKMASAGSDWHDNPATQITWGIGYIRGRYGSPCAALSHSYAKGWY